MLFSDFEDNGPMWAGSGKRQARRSVAFSEPFRQAPIVQVTLSMVDMDHSFNTRLDLAAEAITPDGFDVVFRTWGDTRVARIRVSWTAIGALAHEDDWDV